MWIKPILEIEVDDGDLSCNHCHWAWLYVASTPKKFGCELFKTILSCTENIPNRCNECLQAEKDYKQGEK